MNKPHSILRSYPLGFQWETRDPFLFCAHHKDAFPKGNAELGPDAPLDGRTLGMDFELRDGWRMYHGRRVPGFPAHPHRGFETVTIVTEGFIDHSDSHGAAGRYGGGDVQWMTAGRGLQHAEMFPLLNRDRGNPTELFQVWLNLPKNAKMVEPHFRMLWSETIPTRTFLDEAGCSTRVTIIAGQIDGTSAPDPAPDSWAVDPEHDVAIWLIRLDPGAQWTLPPARHATNRTLYFHEGAELRIDGGAIPAYHAAELAPGVEARLVNGPDPGRILLLQGRAIAEPVAQYGPFVMNTEGEIRQAFEDYQRTQFGGWPWEREDPVHGAERGRFARHADGRMELPGGESLGKSSS